MFKKWRFLVVFGASILIALPLQAQEFSAGYRDFRGLQSAIDALAGAHGNVVELLPVAESGGGRAIQAIRLGAGDDVDDRPALLLLANVWGPHVVGSEVAMNVATALAEGYGQDSATTALLDRRTIYVIPRVNPDAAEAFFRRPLFERIRNDGPADDDHDWVNDEDGADDLNGDGLITMMRVLDPAGEWIADPANPSLMRKAEREKGERGMYRLLTEGRDNDGDESWNEDPEGGTDINANFSYAYDYFGAATGLFQLSSAEARGVADFVIAHPNIAAGYVMGPQDNLLKPWKHKNARGIGGNPEGTSAGGPYSSILEADQPYFERISERFQSLTELDDGPESADLEGDALSWVYYHMGRWAFGSRTWWVPDAPEPSADDEDSETEEVSETPEMEVAEETPGEHDSLKDQYNDFRWLEANVPGGFVDWTPVTHPDFPDDVVEVGGFAPFVRINPPAALIDSLTAGQAAFVAELADALPSIELRDVTVEQVGQRTYRLNAQLANSGYFPTVSAIGVRAFWPRRIRLELDADDLEIVGGRPIQLVGPVEGNGASRDFSWVIVGQPGSSVTLTASSPVAGSASATVRLR